MPKKKKCTRCSKTKVVTKFNPNPRAKDGYLNVCTMCWIASVQKGKAKAKELRASGLLPPHGSSKAAKANGHAKGANGVEVANRALKKANKTHDVWVVIAEDGEQFRTTNREQAARQIKKWQIDDGYKVELLKTVPFILNIDFQE